jgi:hypothetical protein
MPFLNTGLGASVFGGGYANAAVPAAAGASPQGPRTIGQQAFGITAGDTSGSSVPGYSVLIGGPLALGLLVFIWWSLPR